MVCLENIFFFFLNKRTLDSEMKMTIVMKGIVINEQVTKQQQLHYIYSME